MSMPEWVRKRASSVAISAATIGGTSCPSEPDMERRIVREEIGVLNVGAVLHEEGADDLAVLGIDLRGKVAAGILQLLERRHAAEQPEGREHQQQQSAKGRNEPEPFDDSGATSFLSVQTYAQRYDNFIVFLEPHFSAEAALFCSLWHSRKLTLPRNR